MKIFEDRQKFRSSSSSKMMKICDHHGSWCSRSKNCVWAFSEVLRYYKRCFFVWISFLITFIYSSISSIVKWDLINMSQDVTWCVKWLKMFLSTHITKPLEIPRNTLILMKAFVDSSHMLSLSLIMNHFLS
jgi:hypothetical protein